MELIIITILVIALLIRVSGNENIDMTPRKSKRTYKKRIGWQAQKHNYEEKIRYYKKTIASLRAEIKTLKK